MTNNLLRAFVAIPLPKTVQETLGACQQNFKKLNLQASWVKPSNIHLTLKFLGDVKESLIEPISSRLAEAAQGLEEFTVAAEGLGVFPDWKRPRVFWMGLREEGNRMTDLARRIDRLLEADGFPAEKKTFSPHLTLARIKSPQGIHALKKEAETWKEPAGAPFTVSEIKLYKSQLTPKGSIYTVLGTFCFGKDRLNQPI